MKNAEIQIDAHIRECPSRTVFVIVETGGRTDDRTGLSKDLDVCKIQIISSGWKLIFMRTQAVIESDSGLRSEIGMRDGRNDRSKGLRGFRIAHSSPLRCDPDETNRQLRNMQM